MFKVLGLGLLLVVFVGSLFSVNLPDQIDLLGYTVPAKWFSCIAVPFVLSIVAWFYEHFIRRVPAHEREVKGQWFLADTWIDLSGGATALLHTAAAALILMGVTIIDLGDQPALPFILAGEGIAMALLGLMLATAQVEVASVLLLIAAHVCYHLFLVLEKPDFETQPNYHLFTAIVAGVTYFGGYLWERYLRRIQGGTQWEHDSLASIPYLAGTIMLATLLERDLGGIYAPLSLMVLAAMLFLSSSLTLLVGLRYAGVLALALGTASFYSGLYNIEVSITQEPDFAAGILVMLLSYAACERAAAIWEHRMHIVTRGAGALRTLIVVAAAVIGLLGFWEWADPDRRSFFWLAHAMGAMVVGVVFREARYRWVALALYFATVVHFFWFDLANLRMALRFLIAAALTLPGFIISWGYEEFRTRHLLRLSQQRRTGPDHDDSLPDDPLPHG